MASFCNIKSLAPKWYYFMIASTTVYQEFSHLFMKQLGFSALQIGVTSLFGVQHLFIPLLLFLGDKLKVRKTVLCVATIATAVNCLLPLLPLIVNLPTCFDAGITDRSSKHGSENVNDTLFYQASSFDNKSTRIRQYQRVPWISKLYFLMMFSRSMITFLEGVVIPLVNLAVITYLGENRASFGVYYMWSDLGNGFTVVFSAILAWVVRITICAVEGYGYFAAFLVGNITASLSLLSIPWLDFKYETERTINWADVKRIVLNGHYIFVFWLTFFLGQCAAFQIFWEFWYLDGLNASPLVMAGAASIRRPLLAVGIYASSYMLRRMGDFNTLCIAYLMFALSFFALSFTRVYWYVLLIDIVQATGYGLAYSMLSVHVSKAGSKASSGIIYGIKEMCFVVGMDSGALLFGAFFHMLGTQKTLLLYAMLTGITVLVLLLYTKLSKRASEYEKLPENDEDSSDE